MNAIQSIFVLFISYFLTLRLGKYFKVNEIKVTAVFILRTIVSLIYIPISKYYLNDSFGYYITALDHVNETGRFFGTYQIFLYNKLLRKYLYLNYHSATFVFSFIGIIGLLALASNINNLTKNSDRNIK